MVQRYVIVARPSSMVKWQTRQAASLRRHPKPRFDKYPVLWYKYATLRRALGCEQSSRSRKLCSSWTHSQSHWLSLFWSSSWVFRSGLRLGESGSSWTEFEKSLPTGGLFCWIGIERAKAYHASHDDHPQPGVDWPDSGRAPG